MFSKSFLRKISLGYISSDWRLEFCFIAMAVFSISKHFKTDGSRGNWLSISIMNHVAKIEFMFLQNGLLFNLSLEVIYNGFKFWLNLSILFTLDYFRWLNDFLSKYRLFQLFKVFRIKASQHEFIILFFVHIYYSHILLNKKVYKVINFLSWGYSYLIISLKVVRVELGVAMLVISWRIKTKG